MPMFVRDMVPTNSDAKQLRGYLERTLQALDDWTIEVDAQLNTLGQLQALGGINVRYTWEDTINTAVPVPSGMAMANSGQMNTMTELVLSRVDLFGRLALPQHNDARGLPVFPGFVEVQDLFGIGSLISFIQTAPSVQRATDILIPVVSQANSGPGFSQDDEVSVTWWPEELPDGRSAFMGRSWGGRPAFGNSTVVVPNP